MTSGSLLVLATAAALLAAERCHAHPQRVAAAGTRWQTNIGLWLLAGAAAGVLLPGGVSSLGREALPAAGRLTLEVAVIVVLSDFINYWQHRLMHRVPLLWRVHRVHHSDAALDVTTAQRHHPLEVLMSTGVAAGVALLLGCSAPALAIAVFVAGFASVLTHTSLRLPEAIDRRLRLALMTPSVHRIHHSTHQPQTDSNYATVLTCWDRLFGTWRDPADNPVAQIGLDEFAGPGEATLLAALTQPLRSPSRTAAADEAP